ncbi:MAG TPA: hypothetical protein PLI53_12085 [Geobacteraceae bacterium]|nr:hypothetical protein [Geobacteraceae bacterium]
MRSDDISIRRMSRDDVRLAVEWAAGEGWNPGVCDADSFYEADPNGFFIAELNRKPVGSSRPYRMTTPSASWGFIS